jgi:hypothetical protein
VGAVLTSVAIGLGPLATHSLEALDAVFADWQRQAATS